MLRNSIAHGEVSIPVNRDLIYELSQIVIDSMTELINRIIKACEEESYLRI